MFLTYLISVDPQSPESEYYACCTGEKIRLRKTPKLEQMSRTEPQDLNLTLDFVQCCFSSAIFLSNLYLIPSICCSLRGGFPPHFLTLISFPYYFGPTGNFLPDLKPHDPY